MKQRNPSVTGAVSDINVFILLLQLQGARGKPCDYQDEAEEPQCDWNSVRHKCVYITVIASRSEGQTMRLPR